MDHLPWNESTTLDRIKVPYVCRDRLCQSTTNDEFKEFPQSQGWELGESESLAQLAERAQAWLFFGLLSIAGVSPDACVDRDGAQPLVNTKMLPDLLCFTESTDFEATTVVVELIFAISEATDVVLKQVIPLLSVYEALEPIDLWNSRHYAILFSIDILLDTMKPLLRSIIQPKEEYGKNHIPHKESISSLSNSNAEMLDGILKGKLNISLKLGASEPSNASKRAVESLQQASFFPKLTRGVARSLIRAGQCGSLAQRLDLTSSEFYHLISLPTGNRSSSRLNDEGEDKYWGGEHEQCSLTSCNYCNVNEVTYRTRHTRDCVICDSLEVDESVLVDLIRRDEVPVIRSTMDRDGRVSICVQKMNEYVDYTAISHVWVGGMGNFKRNQLPQCQLESIHRDVCRTTARAISNSFGFSMLRWESATDRVRAFLSWFVGTTTCYYWIDTLCIPNNHPTERKEAINSMGRVYAGANAVLVLDLALSSISLHDDGLVGKDKDHAMNMLIQASPWMARSWPLQEAALASSLYVKFADEYVRYEHRMLGMAATLEAIPDQKYDRSMLQWLSFNRRDFGWRGFIERESGYEDTEPVQARPYKPGDDFVKVWNLLSKRTTSYPIDVPAIFAALLYQSAGEILAIDPARRVWSLLGSVDRLPADILCVEREEESARLPLPQQPQHWMPRLPGSSRPVMSLSLEFGSLRRIAEGFVLEVHQPLMLTVVCYKGLPMALGDRFLLQENSEQSYLVHLHERLDGANTTPNTTIAKISKGESISCLSPEDSREEGSQLILLFNKRAPGSLLENCAVLCKVNGKCRDGKRLRVEFLSNAITWRSLDEREQQQSLAYETRACVSMDASSILIEIDTRHWRTLAWSRFNVYPYRHFLAQASWPDVVAIAVSAICWLYEAGICLVDLPVYFLVRETEPDTFLDLLVFNVICLVILVTRIFICVWERALLIVAQKRRARYFWSLSFWDVPRAQKTLSGLPFYVPWYFLPFDAAMMAGAVAIFQGEWLFKLPGQPLLGGKVFVPYGLLFSCSVGLVTNLFARLQWFLSTIEYRGSRDRRPRVMASMMRYMVSALQRNVLLFFMSCGLGLFGWWGLRVCINWLQPGSVTIPMAIIFLVVFFGPAVVASLYLLLYIIWDLIHGALRMYGRNGSIWGERDRNGGPRIELV